MNCKSYFVVTLLSVAGCHAWNSLAKPTGDGSLAGNPQIVRVTRTYNCGETPSADCIAKRGTVTLYNPRVQADSLVGYFDAANNERTAIPMRDVVKIDARQVDPYKTVGATLGIGVLIGAAALVTLIILISSIGY